MEELMNKMTTELTKELMNNEATTEIIEKTCEFIKEANELEEEVDKLIKEKEEYDKKFYEFLKGNMEDKFALAEKLMEKEMWIKKEAGRLTKKSNELKEKGNGLIKEVVRIYKIKENSKNIEV